ncbi:hypothetical protein A3A46_01195 [Candidatus Roizmanbacteria bacterium RIFCSPLOWO2_01_FULL_37_13]|uniref:Uncharacterized protein n=1 Tax=Candidatus Roizmanbacteria bacterium RIFCSPHIGHO2_02_FULL_38_11 TaxID=1802039 RepID=A0A1F7GWK3_9BACT|nr:MAG: hypothetical protein A3C25_03820 [Candidatus Roizmanbacteria bacterium RIFCSPHIGHO2_02_FULL_38_11]OGK41556.1 MAG: hypothetical protein A3A46_01195 [Candidatus Roizmanbacteria bacterium RIFCSPLOWO2_01_FULL_37_13]
MQKNKQLLLNYLKSQHTLYLATYDSRPWTSTVFYAVDNDFTLYFISEPTTRHSEAIQKNKFVSCAIADSNQVVTDKKVGAQIEGITSEVKNKNKLKIIISMWHKKNPGFEDIINLPNMIEKIIKGRFYQIKPTLIKFFNEKLYGDEGFEIFKFQYSLSHCKDLLATEAVDIMVW